MPLTGPMPNSMRRNRSLKTIYERWKETGEDHVSTSGTTASYIIQRCVEEKVEFDLSFHVEGNITYFVVSRPE